MNRIKGLLLLLCLPLAGYAQAEVLSIERCRELALQNNKERKSSLLETQAAEYGRKAMKAQFLPDFSLKAFSVYDSADQGFALDMTGVKQGLANAVGEAVQAGVLGMNQAQWLQQYAGQIPSSIEPLKYRMDWMYGGAVVMKQPLYMGGKIRAAYRMADMAVGLRREGERLTEASVIQKTDEAYAKVVNAVELEQVALKYQEMLAALEAQVASAVKHGLRMESDRLKVKVKMNEVALQLRKAQNGVRLAKMNLCHVTGLPLRQDICVSSEYPAVDAALQLQTDDVSLRPEYAMLEAKVKIAGEQVKMTRSEMLPQLALLAKYGYAQGVKVNGRPLMEGWDFAGGVTLNVPLYHFGEHANKVKAAKVKQEQASLERDDVTEQMLLDLTRAANNLDEARLEVELSESAMREADENVRLSQQQYHAGLETLTDLLESQALWQKAYESRVNARFQFYLSSVDYLRASGLLAH